MRPSSILSLVVAALAAFVPNLRAQERAEPMVTDRPDFTESEVAVAPGRVQLEAGYTFTRADGGNVQEIGEPLLRIGAAPRLELRVGFPTWTDVDVDGESADGLSNTSLGAKLELSDPRRPTRIALLAGTSVPTGDDDVTAASWEPEAILAIGWSVPEPWSLGANAGWSWIDDGDDRRHRGSASLALGRGLTERLAGFLETFGFVTGDGDGESAFLDGGLTLLLSPDLQLDGRVGARVAGESDDWFVGVGLSRRW